MSDQYLDTDKHEQKHGGRQPEVHLGQISFQDSKELMTATMKLLEVLDPLVDL